MEKHIKLILITSILTLGLSACAKESSDPITPEKPTASIEATDHWPSNPNTIRRVEFLVPTSEVTGPDWEIVDGAPASHYGHRTKCRLIAALPNEKEFKVTVNEVVTLMQRDGIVYHISISPLPGGVEIPELVKSLTTVIEENDLTETEEWKKASSTLQSYVDGTEEPEKIRFKIELDENIDLSVSSMKLYKNKREDPTNFKWVYSLKIVASNQAIEEAQQV